MNTKLHRRFFTIILLFLMQATPALAASKEEIDANVADALEKLYQESSSAKQLAKKAAGILVFPEVVKMGVGIGGEFGEGALLVGNKTSAYYNIASASIGFQFGVQVKSQVIMFMDETVLNKFRDSKGWEAGVDGSVAIANIGAGKEIGTQTSQEPIIGFIFSNKGLMYNLTFGGSKITRIKK